ncbi:PQQ-binding-like beta-propeller repeat protein [Acidobacteriota bacterium]
MVKRILFIFGLIIVFFFSGYDAIAHDWPQFRGLNRDGVSPEKGLLQKWPQQGPKLIWKTKEDLGEGHSSVAVAKKIIFTTGMIKGEGVLFAFNLQGVLLWKQNYGPEWKRTWPGSRSTPTIIGSKLYLFSGVGKLICFSTEEGEILWSRHLVEEYQGIKTEWGWAESPLIFDDNVICTPAGQRVTMVALNRHSGKTVWTSRSLGEQHAYCTAIKIKRGQNTVIVNRTEHFLFGINGTNGKILWKYDCKEFMKPAKPPQIHPNPPIYRDGFVYITSGYDAGGAKFSLSEDGQKLKLIWTDKILDVFLGGAVLVGGKIYGANYSRKKKSRWISLDWKTGKPLGEMNWDNHQGVTIYADNRLYCYAEKTGELRLIKTEPSFEVTGSFKIPSRQPGSFWAHPAISDGRLYIRHKSQLYCYDIKKLKKE